MANLESACYSRSLTILRCRSSYNCQIEKKQTNSELSMADYFFPTSSTTVKGQVFRNEPTKEKWKVALNVVTSIMNVIIQSNSAKY